MKITEILVETGFDETKPIDSRLLQQQKRSLNAFHYETGALGWRGDKLVTHYRFYSVEVLKRPTRKSLATTYRQIPPRLTSLAAEQIPCIEKSRVILYGTLPPEREPELQAYLEGHGLEAVQPPFRDRPEEHLSYPELQKALFFAEKMKCPLLLTSVRQAIMNIPFLNLLEKADIRFTCIDFPLLCRENLPLIKATLIYGNQDIPV